MTHDSNGGIFYTLLKLEQCGKRIFLMSQRYFEDLKAGDRFMSANYKVSEEQIISFAREFDPQPFHLDKAVARQTMFEGLIASGWHTAAITMRLFVQTL